MKPLILFFLLFTIHYSLFTSVAFAAPCDPKSDTLCDPLGGAELGDLAKKIATFIRELGLYAIAPLMIVIGGFQIMTAGGSPEKVSNGWKTIRYALIGVIILLVAWGLVSLIKDIIGVQVPPK